MKEIILEQFYRIEFKNSIMKSYLQSENIFGIDFD